ncbi:MAG: hypothetical protein A3C88_02490 [Candidatus Yanofskybacteria bacterium RIFCSPHIGHO2_02_FULL_50_12]|uniref:DEAD/DEAH box helicase n=1 Tax=Candidatus Yanofskybacteria bacterium RIFCSPHIGHO2_02_FULL_50_12 TaxID=1802685 RepID=A0A1F8FV57_9BACT|nr:MAG: hypothetical protein A3C88_02490 [Candidatus Yanofskybacteria bacterium RIFCSPHIGHO2_02_FULL_50_12]
MAHSQSNTAKQNELRERILCVNEILIDQEILPPSMGEHLPMSEAGLQSIFPQRYRLFRKIWESHTGLSPELSGDELDEISKWLYMVNSLDRYTTRHRQANQKDQTLCAPQFRVFEDIKDFLENGGTQGYIKLPTGTGKTVIFLELIEAIGLRALIVVPKKMLIEQTTEKLSEFTEDLDVGRIYADAKEHGRQVTVITYQSLAGELGRGSLRLNGFDLVILDEVHQALSWRRSDVIRELKCLVKIGFTATHRFSDKKQASNLLGAPIHTMEIPEAIEERLLSPYSVIIAETETDITEVPVMGTGDYHPEKLEVAINVAARNRVATRLYRSMFEGKKAIAYCQGVQHALDLAQVFVQAGIPAAAIHGKQKVKEQLDLLRKFRKGEVKVLCNSDILIEGFDEPSASVCLNLRPTLSTVVAEQRGGRILRLDPNDPNKRAIIVEFVDRNRDRKKVQVTFPEVSGASSIGGNSRPSFPEVEGVNIISISEDVDEYVQNMAQRRSEAAPIGWTSSSALAAALGIRFQVVEFVANRLRAEHPEWFQNYLVGVKRYREFYSPELTARLIREVQAKEPAPSGWKTDHQMSRELGRMLRSIQKAAALLGANHPEWFRMYLDRVEVSTEHYSPELVQEMRNYFGKK